MSELLDSKLVVDVQIALNDDASRVSEKASSEDDEEPPSAAQLIAWSQRAYAVCNSQTASVSLRIVSRAEMQVLNATYRGKDKPTNVLSFPCELDLQIAKQLDDPPLGDIVICDAVVRDEAQQQKKTLHDHYAHMVCHGILHLCGYDHQTDSQAEEMEALEEQLLANYGIKSPYLER